MAQNNQRPIIRRISLEEFQRTNRGNPPIPRKRTTSITPPGGGSFTPNELSHIIPPRNARSFKIVRPMGGRYVRDNNPLGLGTEGPFGMDEFPTEDSDLSAFEDLEITKVIFDVGE